MRKNVEKIEKTVVEEKVTYIASDGTVFRDEENCKKWEKSYECTLQKTFNNMQKIEVESCMLGIPYDNEEATIFAVRPKSENDIVTLNSIQKFHSWGGNNILDFNSIGKTVFVQIGYGYDNTVFSGDWFSLYTYEEIKSNLEKT